VIVRGRSARGGGNPSSSSRTNYHLWYYLITSEIATGHVLSIETQLEKLSIHWDVLANQREQIVMNPSIHDERIPKTPYRTWRASRTGLPANATKFQRRDVAVGRSPQGD
jgi:hypothetical protein